MSAAGSKPCVAFIGLGVMGDPMARNVAAAGFPLTVCDGNPAVREAFARDGFDVAETAAAAARGADIVITILPTSGIVRDVVFGQRGAVATARPGALFIDMTTGSAREIVRLGADLAEKGFRLIDAPVGRSRREAVAGKLLAMVGGAEADVAEATPVLSAMADEIVHAGALGCGLRLKLTNNYMAMVNHVLTGEVLALAVAAGLDLPLAVKVMSTTSAGRGQLLTNYPKKVLAGDVTPDFSIEMGIKDLTMALELAEDVAGKACFGELSRRIFEKARAAGFGGQDCTSIFHFQSGEPPALENAVRPLRHAAAGAAD
ncbi:NAD(P)-binding domain-containing protein [Afifella sp. IM 167]|uniref:NAD(P)-dependent oxidoreductase n=1 Tax=Afifella sp. IM 167 TaxID=2033586 RepID=UPI001CCB29D3|nr:hypothetical protein [Afifella sp. IM 167]